MSILFEQFIEGGDEFWYKDVGIFDIRNTNKPCSNLYAFISSEEKYNLLKDESDLKSSEDLYLASANKYIYKDGEKYYIINKSNITIVDAINIVKTRELSKKKSISYDYEGIIDFINKQTLGTIRIVNILYKPQKEYDDWVKTLPKYNQIDKTMLVNELIELTKERNDGYFCMDDIGLNWKQSEKLEKKRRDFLFNKIMNTDHKDVAFLLFHLLDLNVDHPIEDKYVEEYSIMPTEDEEIKISKEYLQTLSEENLKELIKDHMTKDEDVFKDEE